MTKDAHDDPYSPQHRRFVLPCSECGTVGRVHLLLSATHWRAPDAPLCKDCAEIWERVWGDVHTQDNPISMFSPPVHDLITTEDGDELYVVLCPRCDGAGTFHGGYCFKCIGMRYVLQDDKGVQRTARWWQTYQQNRTEESV